MSFKIIISLFILSGCGVKAKPLNPPETVVKSYIDSYIYPVNEDGKEKNHNDLIEKKKNVLK